MGKVLITLGIVVGGAAVFLGSTLAILSFQGRLEGESLRALRQNPILGAFVPDPGPLPMKKDSQQGGDGMSGGPAWGAGSGKEVGPKSDKAQAIPFFQEASRDVSGKEFMEMLESAQEAKVRCEKEWAAIEVEKESLERLQEDLAERKAEIEKTMTELATAKADLDAVREEFRREVIAIEENEDRNIRKLAELYENMKETTTAAAHFNDMEMEQVVKIIVRMDAAKAAKILAEMDAEKVKALTDKLYRFQEKKKEDTKKQ